MEPNSIPTDLEHAAKSAYAPLPDRPDLASPPSGLRRCKMSLSGIVGSLLLLVYLSSLVIIDQGPKADTDRAKSTVFTNPVTTAGRGVLNGVSLKSFPDFSNQASGYPWTRSMLSWQRTAYHFQPEKNWMNDPNGPLFYKGWYHIFYQYNQEAAFWGNITWGHAVSRDLIHWLHLPFAMVPDSWYDINGVWTGSATFLSDGRIVMLYTGDTNDFVQVQNLVYPANLSDPLLLDWVKYEGNPVLVPPPGIDNKDFRDPTTAWLAPDGRWRIAIGSKLNKTGVTLIYATTNFTSFELSDGLLHAVPGTGMWECVDFYPVSTLAENGLDTSFNGPGVKHVLKASLDDDKKDYYAIGSYDAGSETWTPDEPEMDVGIGLRYDWGKFYASKTFYDQHKKRRILWGWIGETDSEGDDVMKGWASVQAIPRTVTLDRKTGNNLIQWPVEEVEKLRLNSTEFNGLELWPGTVVPLNITSAVQLDISATFEVDEVWLKDIAEADVGYNCSTAGATVRGALGPFGIIVLADNLLTELTPVYFYIAKNVQGTYTTFFCSDELRSSTANEVNKRVYGNTVPVLDGEKLTMRVLVDHSIVENYAQGGRTVITSRIYPTKAIHGAERLFVFNNATDVKVKVSLKVWGMESAYISQYPFDDQHQAM